MPAAARLFLCLFFSTEGDSRENWHHERKCSNCASSFGHENWTEWAMCSGNATKLKKIQYILWNLLL